MLIFANLWHIAQMFSQISHTPEFLGKFGVKRCNLSTGGMVCPKKMGNKEVLVRIDISANNSY